MADIQSKPVRTQALQWDGSEAGAAGIAVWVNSQTIPEQRALYQAAHDYVDVETNEVEHAEETFVVLTPSSGWVKVSPQDWVIIDAKGYPYPCEPSIFADRWELASPPISDAAAEADVAGEPRP